MIKTPFNCSASIANVAYSLHKTPREGMSRSMRLQCCAHDKSHACGSLFVRHSSTFRSSPTTHSREREGAPTGQEKTQSSATASRTPSARSARLAMVRRLTRLLYMSMDNVSTRGWRGAPRSCQVRARCSTGVTSRCRKFRVRSKRPLAELQTTRKGQRRRERASILSIRWSGLPVLRRLHARQYWPAAG